MSSGRHARQSGAHLNERAAAPEPRSTWPTALGQAADGPGHPASLLWAAGLSMVVNACVEGLCLLDVRIQPRTRMMTSKGELAKKYKYSLLRLPPERVS